MIHDAHGLTRLRTAPFPVLTTARLILRAVVPDDAAALFAIRREQRVMQYITRPLATTIADAHELIGRIAANQDAGTGITWGLTLEGDDTLIGTIGYYRLALEHFRGEIGYLLAPAYWRQGLMGEALEAAVECGFTQLGFHSVEAVTDPANTASNSLLARHGFVREGLFKENMFWNGRFYDSAVWSRLAPRPSPQ